MGVAYYLTGPDGSGKTTFIKNIENYFLNQGYKPRHIWLRSPKILSKPLMAACRLVGLTKYKKIDGIRYGGHEFYRSRFVSFLFPILQLVDFQLARLFTKHNKSRSDILLYDRYALDTLADLMVDTHRFDMHKKRLGRSFLKMIQNNTRIIILYVPEDEIRSRKGDTKFDPHLSTKIKVYNILAKDLKLKVIDNTRDKQVVYKEIFKHFNLDERN